MKSLILISIAFLIGLGGGWFGKTWFESHPSKIDAIVTTITGGRARQDTNADAVATPLGLETQLDPNQSSNKNSTVQSTPLDGTKPESIVLA